MEDFRLLERIVADSDLKGYEDFIMKVPQGAIKVGLTALLFFSLMGSSIKQTVKPVQLTWSTGPDLYHQEREGS
jgi:hypothetical protein